MLSCIEIRVIHAVAMSPNPKRPSIADALGHLSSRPKMAEVAPVNEGIQGVDSPSPKKKPYVQPGRKSTKAIIGHFDPAVSKQLKQIALDHDSTIQAMLGEALNDLFVKYGKNPIA